MSRWVLRPPVESWGELFLGSMEKVGNITVVEAQSRYKKVDIALIENENIDCLTLGIYTKLIVLGKKWNLNVKGLRSHLGLSDDKVRKALSLLEHEGYIVRTPCRNEKGQLLGWNYTIYPIPVNEDERSQAGKGNENPQVGLPSSPISDHSDNGGLLNNRKKETIELKEPKKEGIDKSIPKKKADNDVDDFVDRMYALYPAKCPKRGTYLGKSQKDKVKIKSLLKTYSESDIEFVIRWEIEQKYNKAYMLNFSTFLNNFPDPTQIDGYNKLNNTSTNTITLPKGWTQERYDMYIRNGYTITEDGRLFKDGKEYK